MTDPWDWHICLLIYHKFKPNVGKYPWILWEMELVWKLHLSFRGFVGYIWRVFWSQNLRTENHPYARNGMEYAHRKSKQAIGQYSIYGASGTSQIVLLEKTNGSFDLLPQVVIQKGC